MAELLSKINDIISRSAVIALSQINEHTPPHKRFIERVMFDAILESIANTHESEIQQFMQDFREIASMLREFSADDFKQALAQSVVASASPDGWAMLLSITGGRE
jgi:hypothetical protein